MIKLSSRQEGSCSYMWNYAPNLLAGGEIGLKGKANDLKISILIPCHNEEKSIKKCLESCLKQSRRPDQIVVVNDGSSDRSLEIIEQFGDQATVVNLSRCSGNKSYAQEFGLWFISGDIFIATDADTVLDKHFVARVEADFQDDNLAAVCGYVKSLKYNWLTACREIDYVVGQTIHKLAQSYLKFLLVIPGCASAFRTALFRRYISFDHDTVAEDLDFTYKFNEQGLKIKFNQRAIVYTQDPSDLISYIRQMKRWYGGGWQNLLKHYRVVSRPASALELSMAYAEGLLFPVMLFFIPLLNLYYFGQFLILYFCFSFLAALYASIVSRRKDLLWFFPLYLIVAFINSWVFTQEFFKEIILRKKKLVWFQASKREII